MRFLSEIITMIHQYKLNGYNIVIDAHCGAIHLVDDLVYDIIELYEGNKTGTIVELLLKNTATAASRRGIYTKLSERWRN